MSDILQSGQEWLADQLKECASREVTYARGVEQVVVQATIGRTLLKLDDSLGGVRMEWTDRDFLIQTVDLVLQGNAVLPDPGDIITDELSGSQQFEVLAYGNEPCWRYSDPYGKLLRIHTKTVS